MAKKVKVCSICGEKYKKSCDCMGTLNTSKKDKKLNRKENRKHKQAMCEMFV